MRADQLGAKITNTQFRVSSSHHVKEDVRRALVATHGNLCTGLHQLHSVRFALVTDDVAVGCSNERRADVLKLAVVARERVVEVGRSGFECVGFLLGLGLDGFAEELHTGKVEKVSVLVLGVRGKPGPIEVGQILYSGHV